MNLYNRCRWISSYLKSKGIKDTGAMKYVYIRKFPYSAELNRYIRGDVIKVKRNGVSILEFADQSTQYSMLLGIGDIKGNISQAELTVLRQFI